MDRYYKDFEVKKILFLGPEVSDFLNPLAKKLQVMGFAVDLLENRKVPRSSETISESYSNVLNHNDLSGRRITIVKILKYLLTIEFYKTLIKILFFNCLEDKAQLLKSIRKTFADQHNKEIFSPTLNSYDIINFHSLSVGTLSIVNYISPRVKIILSYWGSDLFQIWGSEDDKCCYSDKYYLQLEALKRADIITVHSYEMERAVVAKFGQDVKDKIVRLLFGIKDELFDQMDHIKQNSPDLNFLKKYNIPENKIKITVGYCGDPICNHLPILEELNKFDAVTKLKIHLLVPMTYGYFTNEYMQQVILKLKESEISFTLFDKYLPLDELLKFRVTSDIMIMMNKSDALSASVCEAIYADNLLISAGWLPYSPLRLEKIFFYETDFSQLGETVKYALSNFDEVIAKLVNNPAGIKKLTSSNSTVQQWIDLLNSLS
ncbi:MAG TPA: hypothetical protein VLH59_05570 [Ignavibacteriaceae bacterium]|nr:hypothetical protein [Ignavibacteriaceae bacterium]